MTVGENRLLQAVLGAEGVVEGHSTYAAPHTE